MAAVQSNFPADLLLDLGSTDAGSLRARLEHGIRAAVQQGRLVGGVPLPATRTLAAELGISRSVVVEAYRNLEADGYLKARRGSGTRVRGEPCRPERPNGRPAATRPLGARREAIRLFAGVPSPTLFPRTQWTRHYRAALAQAPDRLLTYPDVAGARQLRAALAGYLGRVRGLATSPEQLLVCGGVTQGISLVCRALGRLGVRRVAVEDPCFGPHRSAIAMAGLEPVPVTVDQGGLSPEGLERRDVQAVLVAPAHSYPSGAVLGVERRHALVAWAARCDGLVIEDDYDAEFRYDRAPAGALQGLAPERVLYIGSASKTVSPALRLGWIAAPPHLHEPLVREKFHDDMGSPLLEQLAFARFVESGDFARYLRRVRPVYRARRDAAIEALDEHLPQARWQGAAAGLHVHVLLPGDVEEPTLVRRLADRGVLLDEAAPNWAHAESAPPSLVIGYGPATEPAIRRGIATIAEEVALMRPRR